jgi:deoxyribose-phosphate aldolase
LDEPEFQRIVTAIGEEILVRLAGSPARQSAGGAACCPGCAAPDAAACAAQARQMVAAGATRLSCCPATARVEPSIAALIDHTLLRPEATRSDVLRLCMEARQFGFAAVCVNPYWVPLAAAALRGTTVKVCTVAGFPLGASMTEIKRAEAEAAIRAGASEVDMVINIGALRSADYDTVKIDIQSVVEVCHRAGALVKVILETALLDHRQKVIACVLAKLAGADFVKTSTGFGPGGATVEDVALMRQVVGPEMGVKAAGGIRTPEQLRRLVAAGATRIGASASVRIIEGAA